MTWLDADTRAEARRMLQPVSETEYFKRIDAVAPMWIRLPGRRLRVEDMTGRKFGMLTVIGPVRPCPHDVVWQCRCDCGRSTVALGSNLRSGNTRSCGCLRGVRGGEEHADQEHQA